MNIFDFNSDERLQRLLAAILAYEEERSRGVPLTAAALFAIAVGAPAEHKAAASQAHFDHIAGQRGAPTVH